MTWSKQEISNHLECCKTLAKIKDDAFAFISKNPSTTEYDVAQFILAEFKKNKMNTTLFPIVAFNENAAIPHYFPKKNSKMLTKDNLILIDLWATFKDKKTPYSDITWMGTNGKISSQMQKVCDIVFLARDRCVEYLKKELKNNRVPTGKELDAIARDVIKNAGYGKYFVHGTGHSIGYTSPHGPFGRVRWTNPKRLLKNVGYTIEPGIYLKGRFGVRSEIDFYINSDNKLVITTPVQKRLVKV